MASYDDTATVSGSVVGFSNGADSVPLKNWQVTLPASLSGYSEVNGTKSGKNLLPNLKYQGASTRVNIGQTDDNYSLHLKAGTYTLSATSLVQMRAYYRTSTGGSNVLIWSTYGTSGSGTFTLSEDSNVRIWLYNGDGLSTSDVQTFQLEVGSTATAYEPYTAPIQYTASLGRTIYGGTADIVTGEGESSYKIITVGNSGWNYYSAGGYIYRDFADKVIPEIGDSDHVLVTDNPDMPYGGVNYASQFQDLHIYQVHNPAIYIKDTSCTSLNDFYTKYSDMQIGYELATPETFTFTPITAETAKGSNTFWSDQGNTELTYYKDGYGFTSVTIHKETPDGEPVEQTAKLHKVIYCGLVDVVKGKAEPKNLAELSNDDNANRSSFSYTTEKPELIEWTKTGSGGKFYARFILHIPKPGKYTISCTNNSTLKAKYIYSDELWGTAVYSSVSQNPFVAEFSASGDYVMGFYAGSSATSGTLGEVMCEEGETQTSYAPYFAPFSFPPISMETDEGENTLYADEGDSAITYRKAVD